MRCSVLALDFDGTIAVRGELDPGVRAAIGEARSAGLTVVLVTGRILEQLAGLVGDFRFLDAVVAENGAVMTFPAQGRTVTIAASVPVGFVDALQERGVEAIAGSSVVEADATSAPVVLETIHTLCLPRVIIFNRDRLMVLPSGVNKATGLRAALRVLRCAPRHAIGIGDAENDHDLLDACGLGVAVAWGNDALIARADAVIEGTGPPAVADYIRRVATQPVIRKRRR